MKYIRRASWGTVLACSGLILITLAGASSAHAASYGDPAASPGVKSASPDPAGTGHSAGQSSAPKPDQAGPIIGAAVTILADGTAPWEDRPFTVAGLGSLPGTRGLPDPGDDVGPGDQVVRSWDAVVYRAAFSVRGGTAEDVVAEVALTGPATWEPSQLGGLRLSGCPGGAELANAGQLLRCHVGRVQAPPAVTVALDLTARVRGSALQGDLIDLGLAVRSSNATADPDPANCPIPGSAGCDASAPQVTVSAAPAGELRKSLTYLSSSVRGGVLGREMGWLLEAVVGADGDVRGSSDLVGGPWQLPDWWRATSNGRTLNLTVSLVGCTDLDGRAAWTCAQPGGPGTAVDVTMGGIDVAGSLPNGVGSSLPQVVARGQIVLWVPEDEVLDSPSDVTFTNCYATERGHADRTLWAPSDSRGQPNLGGRAEPASNNCSFVVLAVPQPTPAPRVPPYRPGRGRPGRGRPPVIRPTPTAAPIAVTLKHYTPYTQGEAVTDGSQFAAEVRVQVSGGGVMAGVIACDKWDNSTHTLRDAGTAGARAWVQEASSPPRMLSEENEVVLEYATGNWGRRRPPQITVGRAWYQQSMASCADNAPVPGVGWVADRDVDFTNQGAGRINASDVNMVRARFVDDVPAGTNVWLEVMFTAELNSPGTWLMNYAASRYGTASRASWQVAECYGAVGSSTRRACPIPAANTRSMPGSLGDMLVHVGVPVWITKRTDPVVPGGSPVVNAGEKAAFAVQISTFPRPADPPPPVFPPEAIAPRVIVTDTLPWSLVYEPGSATIASEDLNSNGRLDPGEDKNGNGRIDRNVPFEPTIQPLPNGETAIGWAVGDLPFRVRVPEIRYETQVSRLVRGGTAVTNQAGVHTSREPAPDCRPGARELEGGRCAWAQIVVANIAAAQVEKVPARPVVFAGEDLIYRLALANLTSRPVEWFDAVDILPRANEPRAPGTRLSGPWSSIAVNVAPGGAPLEVWVSASDPALLDTFGGGPLDGLVDPVAAWGGPGAGVGGAEWPCRLSDVGSRSRCPEIASAESVTALRLWGPDPRPASTGRDQDSFLPAGSTPRLIDVVLQVPGSQPDDLANNAWGGRFESLPLPVFDDALIRVRGVDTPTPTITPTPQDTPTSTPTETATPRPYFRAYLPAALHVPCRAQAVDVVLVVDASSSMRRAAGDGGTKHEAVLRAAHGFLDRFELGDSSHRVAVVAFNHHAWVAQELTSDRALLDRALDGLPGKVEEGTRLDLGLLAGADALGAVTPGQVQAMVFLTDGLPNRVPTPQTGGSQNDTVLAAAAEVRGRGILIHTVGYGRADAPDVADRILPELLRAIAGSPAGYHETDDAGELAIVFRRLALDVSCAVQRVWP